MNAQLTFADYYDFTQAEKAILVLMKDGRWHSASEIIKVGGQREALRRMRNLRKKGYEIEKERRGESRDFWYRLTR